MNFNCVSELLVINPAHPLTPIELPKIRSFYKTPSA